MVPPSRSTRLDYAIIQSRFAGSRDRWSLRFCKYTARGSGRCRGESGRWSCGIRLMEQTVAAQHPCDDRLDFLTQNLEFSSFSRQFTPRPSHDRRPNTVRASRGNRLDGMGWNATIARSPHEYGARGGRMPWLIWAMIVRDSLARGEGVLIGGGRIAR